MCPVVIDNQIFYRSRTDIQKITEISSVQLCLFSQTEHTHSTITHVQAQITSLPEPPDVPLAL